MRTRPGSSRHTEDIALSGRRAVGHVELFTGRPQVSFRMYPRLVPR